MIGLVKCLSRFDRSLVLWCTSSGRGTEIVLHLKEDAGEFLTESSLKSLIHRYSEFITFPIYQLVEKEEEVEVEDDEEEVGAEDTGECYSYSLFVDVQASSTLLRKLGPIHRQILCVVLVVFFLGCEASHRHHHRHYHKGAVLL